MSIIFTVPQSHEVVITRLGKFSRVAKQGLTFKIPFIESIHHVDSWENIANKNGYQIEMSEQTINTKPNECHTKDNVAVKTNASIYWRITDTRKAVFDVDKLPVALIDSCINALRSNIGKLNLDQVLQTRKELNESIYLELESYANKWGVKISRVEIQELSTSDETAEAMRQEMTAERLKRAKILEANGIAKSKIIIAEGEAKALTIQAEAEAFYINKLSDSIGKDETVRILLADKMLASYKKISENPANKVFLPTSNLNMLFGEEAIK